jgi:hypothetical protein
MNNESINAFEKALEMQAASGFYPAPEAVASQDYITRRDAFLEDRRKAFETLFNKFHSERHRDCYPLIAAALQFHLANQQDQTEPQAMGIPDDFTNLCKNFSTDPNLRARASSCYRTGRLTVVLLTLALYDEAADNELQEELPEKILHYHRRHALETCLGLLGSLVGEIGDDPNTADPDFSKAVRLALARALLYRARIIRVKSFTIPEKKKAALRQAYEICRDEQVFPADNLEAGRLKAEIYLELIRLKELPGDTGEEDFFVYLEVLLVDSFDPKRPIDSEALLYYARRFKDTSALKPILENIDEILKHSPATAACAAFLADHHDKAQVLTKAIDATGQLPFSHSSWVEMTKLLKEMAAENDSLWQDSAIALWEKCREREELSTHNCHLRWYWSHHQDLYDLAFHAAHDPARKAEIADSLKGRTAVHRQVLEELRADDENLRNYLEAEDAALAGRFAHDINQQAPHVQSGIQRRELTDLPADDWLVVHFYIGNGATPNTEKNKGYALIYDGKKKKWFDEPKTFSAENLWQPFKAWQEDYQQRPRGERFGSAPQLVKLARAIGTELAFLFELPADQPVVFIPYGFLHRLPLHMGIQETDNVSTRIWAAEHQSCFLPNWSTQKQQEEGTAADTLLKKFDGYDYASLLNQWGANFLRDPAPSTALTSLQKKFNISAPPRNLAILTHGTAHPVNPFASALLFEGVPLRLLDLLAAPQTKMNLTGSRVVLGACETDMMLPQTVLADEHLSFAAAFLQKGAGQVISGLYEVHSIYIQDLCVNCITDKPPIDFSLWQSDIAKDVANNKNWDDKMFYNLAVFRQLGWPSPAATTGEEILEESGNDRT